MVFANCSSAADQGKHNKKKARNLEPQDVKDTSNALEGHAAGAIKRPNPAIFAGFSPRNPQESASLSTEIAGWQA
jgi:hypothetical protein